MKGFWASVISFKVSFVLFFFSTTVQGGVLVMKGFGIFVVIFSLVERGTVISRSALTTISVLCPLVWIGLSSSKCVDILQSSNKLKDEGISVG